MSLEHLKKQAKNLHRHMPGFVQENPSTPSLSACQELIAKSHGYPSWHIAVSKLSAPQSQYPQGATVPDGLNRSVPPTGTPAMNAQQIFDALNARFGSDESVANFLPDQTSLDIMYERILGYARHRQLAPYSTLVAGIPFRQEVLYGKNVHFIEPGPWIGQDRRMVGTALAQIAIDHLQDANALITSIVVLKEQSEPSSILFEWLAECGVLPKNDQHAVYAFWGEQIAATHRWARRQGGQA